MAKTINLPHLNQTLSYNQEKPDMITVQNNTLLTQIYKKMSLKE